MSSLEKSANPVAVESVDWVVLREGVSMRPLHFEPHGYTLQLKVEPGTTITRHRHTGEVHALNVSGHREIIDTGEIIGPGDFVYEQPGNTDMWRCHGDKPCIVHITTTGRVEYLDAGGAVQSYSDSGTAKASYLAACMARGVEPDARIVGDVMALEAD